MREKLGNSNENGRATAEGTAAYARRFPQLTYVPFDGTGWQVSQAGFGSYRVDADVAVHHEALREALTRGINLIDTSANYSDGGSETLIGNVLEELCASGAIDRSEIVVVSKVGYLQGQNYALSQQRKAAERPFPELVEYSNGLEHCIHPEFLADQLTRSLARLQLQTIDCYLLHNPEYYLGWAKKFDEELDDARTEYYRRIEQAFRHLEIEVAAGRISSYGISSNSFPNPAESYDFTSLEKVWQIAESISPTHHFKAVQLPFNLLETGAATERNQSDGRTVLELARAHNVAVLVNRPLNAIQGHNIVRLATVFLPTATEAENPQAVVKSVAHLEEQLQQEIFNLPLPFRTQQEFAATLAAARLLHQRWPGFGSLGNWQDVRDGYILPRAQMGLRFLRQRPESSAEMKRLGDAYEEALQTALQQITAYYQRQAAEDTAQILAQAHAATETWRTPSLSQTAVRALRTTAGVTSVLVGMRQPRYVDDVVAELENPLPQADHTAAWQALGGDEKLNYGGTA